jgi:Tol biopolymer transport system component
VRHIYTLRRNRRPLQQSHRLIVLLMVVLLASLPVAPRLVAAGSTGTQSAVVSQTTTLPVLTGTFQVVDTSAGDQINPGIDCDLAAYTSDDLQGNTEIRYFDFSTNTGHTIPKIGAEEDFLSAVSGSRIAFTEVNASGSHIVVYDTASQVRTEIPGDGLQSSPAFGGNLVAFEDRSFSTDPNQSEIVVYELATGATTRLTNDALQDKNVAVSPTGNAVVWEKCQINGTGCHIYAAIQTGPGVFTTSALTGAPDEDHDPATNGQIVVYTSTRNGETDIYFQPIGGGVETQLSVPGVQRNPNISGNLIALESEFGAGTSSDEFDILVYDLTTGNLYQVTNTPVSETLNHISVCNGIGRIVYGAPGAIDFDVFAFTFQPPSSTTNQINDLVALVQSFTLPQGTETSLIAKLEDALAAIAVSDTATACNSLTDFINETQAQSGKKLTADQASQLINLAIQIKTGLGCQ